jgi:hypothetical protein
MNRVQLRLLSPKSYDDPFVVRFPLRVSCRHRASSAGTLHPKGEVSGKAAEGIFLAVDSDDSAVPMELHPRSKYFHREKINVKVDFGMFRGQRLGINKAPCDTNVSGGTAIFVEDSIPISPRKHHRGGKLIPFCFPFH